MDIEDILVLVGLLLLMFGFAGWRLDLININKSGIDRILHSGMKSAGSTKNQTSKTVVSKGSYIITITNPTSGKSYQTTDYLTGITLSVSVDAPDKFTVTIYGQRGDVHTVTVEVPSGGKYYSVEYLINHVSIKDLSSIRGTGITDSTKVKLDFLYRVLGDEATVIVVYKPYVLP